MDPRARVVVGKSSGDPYLARYCGGGQLAASFVVHPAAGAPRLGYLSPMERLEAAKSGLELLHPEDLDILRWTRDGASPDELWAGVLSRAFHLCELSPGVLAVAGNISAGIWSDCRDRLEAEGWSFTAAEPWLDLQRKRKSDRELESIRESAAGVVAAFHRVAELLRLAEKGTDGLRFAGEPITVGRLRREVAWVFCGLGLSQPEGNIIAPAGEGAVPHNIGTDERVIRPGETLVVDLYPKKKLFADCTRTFCVGPAPKAADKAHGLVVKALELAENATQNGACGWQLQRTICDFFQGRGYATPIHQPGTRKGYVHGLGHGVGYGLHELPTFRPNLEEPLSRIETGDVITLEPGLYDEEAGWAVRVEDLYAVGEQGLENLTPLPRSLRPEDWD